LKDGFTGKSGTIPVDEKQFTEKPLITCKKNTKLANTEKFAVIAKK
jgi:hypothetical protein